MIKHINHFTHITLYKFKPYRYNTNFIIARLVQHFSIENTNKMGFNSLS